MLFRSIGTGTTYINLDGETGLVAEPANSGSLNLAINKLWSNPDMALIMGDNARNRFEQHFTANVMVRRYMKLYGDVINNHHRADAN